MAKVSIREAAKRFKVSRPTLANALKNGIISGQQDDRGRWQIDVAELIREYEPRKSSADSLPGKKAGDLSTVAIDLPGKVEAVDKPDDVADLRRQLADAEKRAAVAEALADERAQRIDDLRRLLPGPGEAPAVRRKLWPFR